jgi:SAM-dependent methyltransferase
MPKLDIVLEKIKTNATNNSLLKITLGNKKEKTSDLKNVFVKPVQIKNEFMLSFVYRHNTNDVTKNYNIADSITEINKLVENNFYNADLYTTTETIYYTTDKNNKEKISTKQNTITTEAPTLRHNKEKQRIINSKAVYLQALGITSTEGQVKAAMQYKYKQINRYVEIIEGILKAETIADNFSVVDMGSGKGYLTFALYEYLNNKNKAVKITGVELRPDLVVKCNNIAAQSNFTNLQFIEGSIQATALPPVDMLIALHACDTATDDAIMKGIKNNAKYIICAPCCHKQIRRQVNPSNVLQQITKHGILLERQAEMITDTIRALVLEAHGYDTKVFDFIEEEDTPKNVMLVGKKNKFSEKVFTENMEKVQALKNIFGIEEHYIETIITQ